MANEEYTRPELLTTPADLQTKLGGSSLILIDTRPAEKFARGHIPGAIHFDLFGLSLTDTSPAPLKAFMAMIAHVFEMRGVNLEKQAVFYDDDSGMRAARGFWFLEYFGHQNVQVLDGGINGWMEAGRPVTTEAVSPKAAQFKTAERRELLATAEDVLHSLNQKTVCIVDTRSDDEHMGRAIRAARGGAIPGAVHLEWVNNLDSKGRYKPAAELRQMYSQLVVTPDKEVIPYCQGGYRSAHTYLSLI